MDGWQINPLIPKEALLEESVGNNMSNRPSDVLRAKSTLSSVGVFEMKEPEPHHILTREMDTAIKDFQTSKNLKVDGVMRPGGETERKLIEAAGYSSDGNGLGLSFAAKRQAAEGKEDDGEGDTPPPKEEKDAPEEKEDKEDEQPDEKEKPDCEEEEIALINAEASLVVAEQSLSVAEEELVRLQAQLTVVNENIAKEKRDKESARRKGGAAGAVIGGALSSGGGPGGVAAGIGLGLGAGSKIGPLLEEIHDGVTSDATDFTLQRQKVELEKKIAAVKEKIANALRPAVNEAKKKASLALKKFRECKSRRDN